MPTPREFEWDDAKSVSNEVKHGVPFTFAVHVFEDPDSLAIDASRLVDGEARLKIIGRVQGRLFTVVFTRRGEVYRIISARRSNVREEQSYGDRSI
jgi:uncharacterized DUF497 family protein